MTDSLYFFHFFYFQSQNSNYYVGLRWIRSFVGGKIMNFQNKIIESKKKLKLVFKPKKQKL